MFKLIIMIFILFIIYILIVILINFIFNKKYMMWLFNPIGVFKLIEWVNLTNYIHPQNIKHCCFNCKFYKYKQVKIKKIDKVDIEFINTCNDKYKEEIINEMEYVCNKYKINKNLLK